MIKKHEIEIIRASTRDIVQCLGYLDNLFAHIGSVSQCHALHKLERRNLTLQELSLELGLDRSTVSRLAKGLVDRGYCIYIGNKVDRRSRYLELTSLGKSMLKEIHKTATKQVKTALQKLNHQERVSVSQGLELYAAALKSMSATG